MKAFFEEKTYEQYFNIELSRKTSIFFPPGQVQEGTLGFDVAAFSRNRILWRLLGYPFWLSPYFDGVQSEKIVQIMEAHLQKELNELPPMKVNLLFQYKRPEYISVAYGAEWKHWNEPYYRYDVYSHQQELLMHLHSHLQTEVLILYASPAFHTQQELVRSYKEGDLIEKSNFKQASELQNHHRNTYTQAGRLSIACSDPVKLENFNLFSLLESYNQIRSNEDNIRFIGRFQKSIEVLIGDFDELDSAIRLLMEDNSRILGSEVLYSLVYLFHFTRLTGLQWLVKN